MKLLHNKSFVFTVILLFYSLCNSVLGESCGPDFAKGIEEYQSKNYESAIQIFTPISKSTNFSDECIGNAFIYLGICEYLTGNSNQAQAEFIEAIKHYPNIKLPNENLEQDIINLFINTKSRLLCDIEIFIQTPFEASMYVNKEVKLIYRMENVLVGKIKILPSKYNEYDREYNLVSGKLNRFYLQIERLRDYYAYDSLALSFYPHEYSPETKKFEELGDGSFVVKSGSQKILLNRDHYETIPLTSIEIKNDGPLIRIPVLETTKKFNKLLRDLFYNRVRSKFNNGVKKVSLAGFIVCTSLSIYTHTKLNSAYDDYLLKVYPNEVQDAYREYVSKVHKRNNYAIFAGVFALIRVITDYTEPRKEEDILNDYNTQNNHKLSLLIKPDVIGLKYTLPL